MPEHGVPHAVTMTILSSPCLPELSLVPASGDALTEVPVAEHDSLLPFPTTEPVCHWQDYESARATVGYIFRPQEFEFEA